ncbi:Uncharacterized protein dnl_05430 [Desulfonema limicola]|uniref:Uncharacterized protein n=1 Tax=Desulfonema limicola TaxID=45656 RepID=A0A975B3W5_9BACT|nr:hypothetical protein [Desulfonema limicola]QTA78322.1 Uncharacterized protein dnl_05430 [Desulfonema limicola]
MQQYPENHQEIVRELLEGKFILYNHPLFVIIYNNALYYKDFFSFSFGYNLIVRNDFVYLTSKESKEKLSRNIVIFLSALCYELNEEGRNFKLLIENSIFDYDEIYNYLQKSTFKETIESIIKEDLDKFLNRLNRINLIEFTDSNKHKFKFTNAVQVFFEYASELAKRKIMEQNKNEDSDQSKYIPK